MARVLQEYAVLLYQARMASGYETRLQATAKSACCSIEQRGRYERGERLPKIETAACLALAYRCEEVLTKRVELAKNIRQIGFMRCDSSVALKPIFKYLGLN